MRLTMLARLHLLVVVGTATAVCAAVAYAEAPVFVDRESDLGKEPLASVTVSFDRPESFTVVATSRPPTREPGPLVHCFL